MTNPRLVILESPYAGDVLLNTQYARAALRDSIHRGEAPLASHLLYTQPGVLDDAIPDERLLGINSGLAWGHFADSQVFYCDRGWSGGMVRAYSFGLRHHWTQEFRSLHGNPASPPTIHLGAPT